MTSTFYRLTTDHHRTDVPLDNLCSGPMRTACWLMGGGPSLTELPLDQIAAAPIPRMGINLAGVQRIRPNFWTSYDPSARFPRSVYLDAGVMKFVHRRRFMDLVPGTNFKVCECPNLFFFDRDSQRGYRNFLQPNVPSIVDWADSLVQAIDILYHLGFRVLFLIGCEMRIHPAPEHLALAERKGITYNPLGTLQEFLKQCEKAGLSSAELEAAAPLEQYHFPERKPLRAAVQTDLHYYRIAQYLRLSRQSISQAGMQIISCTPNSRLNDYFPFMPVERALRWIAQEVSDPTAEEVQGAYSQTDPPIPPHWGSMKDFPPHGGLSAPRRTPPRDRAEILREAPRAALPAPEVIDCPMPCEEG